MKLHHPAEEREFLRIATEARAGRPLEAGEPLAIGPALTGLLKFTILLALITRLLLGHPDKGWDESWRVLIASLLLMVISAWNNGRLNGIAADCGAYSVLPNLPISSENIMRLIRCRFFLRQFWSAVLFCTAVSITANGATENIWMLAGNIALLTAITASNVVLMSERWLWQMKVIHLWSYLSLSCLCVLVWVYIYRRHFFLPDGSPEWVLSVLQGITWIYPPSWAMSERFGNGGAWLCAIWIGLGFWKWTRWPQDAGRALDQNLDFADTCEDHGAEENALTDGVSEIEADLEESPLTSEPTDRLTLPAPLAMTQAGWVDRWVDAVIGHRCRLLAGAICDPYVTWTKQTVRLLVAAPLWLLMAWLIMHGLPDAKARTSILVGIWIIPICSAIFLLLPFSNAIPRAMNLCGPGLLQAPFFAEIPVSARDLLRVSFRITLARSFIMAMISGPFFSALLMITFPGLPPWPLMAAVGALAVFWVFSRPVFITYRLRAAGRRRRGVVLLNAAAVLTSIFLGILWFAGGVIGTLACSAFSTGQTSPGETGLTVMLALGGLIGSGLCARAIFEIHHWQVRRGHFDWLHIP